MSIPGMEDYPIKLGTLLFTMVEPEKGREVEYNRWYEHDHFYSGCMVGEWQFAGDRFVATKRLKALRYPQQTDMTPDPLTGSYLAVYWVLDGKHDEWNQWAVEQVTWLHANGRMFEARTHVHTLLYEKRWAHRATDGSCTIELALDHNYPGLVVVAGDVKDGHTHDEVDAWFRETYLPDACAQPWGPDVVLDATDAAAARRTSGRRAAARGRTEPVPPAALPRPRPRGGLGRRLREDRPGDRGQRPRHPRVDGPVHPDRLRDRQVHRRALVGRASVEGDDAVAGRRGRRRGRAHRTTGAAACGVASVNPG